MKPASISHLSRITRVARSLRRATLCAVSLLAVAASTSALARQNQVATPSDGGGTTHSVATGSGNIWRCEQAGKTSYSTTPCATTRGAKALETLQPRSAADVREAQQRAAQERQGADALTRERQTREARETRQLAMQSRPANLGPEKARPAPAAGTANAALRRPQPVKLGEQLLRGLDARRVDWDAGHRAQLHALRLVEVAHTFGATRRVDHIDLRPHRDRLIGALGLAHITVDALVGDPQRHGLSSDASCES
jgi:hypothetical protein